MQFERWARDIFVNLDEPVQLIDPSSNILNVIAHNKADDTDKIASIISDFESDGTVWVVCADLYCYTS